MTSWAGTGVSPGMKLAVLQVVMGMPARLCILCLLMEAGLLVKVCGSVGLLRRTGGSPKRSEYGDRPRGVPYARQYCCHVMYIRHTAEHCDVDTQHDSVLLHLLAVS